VTNQHLTNADGGARVHDFRLRKAIQFLECEPAEFDTVAREAGLFSTPLLQAVAPGVGVTPNIYLNSD
jgi:hypothetical protein